MLRKIAKAVAILILFSGCANQEETVMKSFIPIAEQKANKMKADRIRNNDDECKKESFYYIENERIEKDHYYKFTYNVSDGYQYDVRRTDSVVTPYVGTVIIKYAIRRHSGNTELECQNNPTSLADYRRDRATYLYQNKQWVLQSVLVSEEY